MKNESLNNSEMEEKSRSDNADQNAEGTGGQQQNTGEEQADSSFGGDPTADQGDPEAEETAEASEEKDPAPDESDAQAEEKSTENGSKSEKDRKLEELEEKYLRLFSEFDNYKKRTKKEKADIIRNASGDIIKQLLPVLDDFERAIQTNRENEVGEEKLKEGFELIYNKLKDILEKEGLQEMEAKGKLFNVEEHEAMTKQPAPSKEEKGKVIEEVEKGYYLNDNVLRFAKVVVGE